MTTGPIKRGRRTTLELLTDEKERVYKRRLGLSGSSFNVESIPDHDTVVHSMPDTVEDDQPLEFDVEEDLEEEEEEQQCQEEEEQQECDDDSDEDSDDGDYVYSHDHETINCSELSKKSNKIVSFEDLSSTIENNLVCARCASTQQRTVSRVVVTEITVGLATTISLTCGACVRREGNEYRPVKVVPQCLPPQCLPPPPSCAPTEGRGGRGKLELGNYVINVLAVLLMYDLGIGIRKFGHVLGLLGIRPAVGGESAWKKLENTLLGVLETLSKVCMMENIKAERQVTLDKIGVPGVPSENWVGNRLGLFTSWDMGWQKRAAGMAYNSMSGVGFLLGAHTKRVLCLSVFSKMCRTCETDKKMEREPTEHRCPQNHDGSSKSMESTGALQSVLELYAKTDDVYVCGTRAILSHSYKDLYPTDRTKWPRTPKGNLKSDSGKIPVNIPAVEFKYCDKAHRRKAYGSACYKVEKGDSQLKKPDCERLKRNFGLCLYQNTGSVDGATMDTFKTRMKAVIEHTFNNHQHCSETWCNFMKMNDEELDGVETKSRFLDKKKGDTYKNLLEAHNKFTTDAKLVECFHDFPSQKNETMNKKVSVTAPKDKTFCLSLSLTGRVHFVAIRDSIGELEAVLKLLTALGFDNLPPSTEEHLHRTDRILKYENEFREKDEIKIKRNVVKTEKLRADLQKQEQDRRKGLTYQSNIAMEDDGGVLESQNPSVSPTVIPASASKPCKCGSLEHRRTSHKDCPHNKNNL